MAKLFQRIQEQIINIPEKVVLSSIGEEKHVTFRELDILSGKVYRYLRDRGIGRNDFVNILLPRGVEPFIAMLGVWRAGAAFVVLEEDYPSERVAFIQKDCGCKMILDRAAWEEIMGCEPLEGFAAADDHDAAFAVYTSGTTGTPKGVLHEYGNLDLIAQSVYMNGESVVNPENHYAMIAPLNFIVVILVYIGILDAGVQMSVVPFSIVKNPPALVQAFTQCGVDTVFCAPSIYRLFQKIPTLKKIFLGSEPSNGIWSDDPELVIYNGYCMSETAFCVTMGQLDKPNDIAPIGIPWTRLKVTVRDEEGNPVPDGAPGELCVENPFVRGYINRPEETAAAFVNGEFHTRDLARRLPDGQYAIIGRIDDMIKISGNRVEPAEIEVAISRITGLQQIVACGFGEGEDTFICLYYADPVELDADELREKLEDVLPYYMIPSHFIHLDALPRTATGKISRRLLPRPAEEQKEYVEPENDTARALCDAMASVLGLARFSAEEDFYRMGGSSVTSMEVVGTCGLPGLSINQIFRGRTPNRIAEIYVSEAQTQEGTQAQEENLHRPCPLSQSQLGIFLECEMHEGEAIYNNPLLFKLPRDVDADRVAECVDRTMRAHPGLFAAIITDEDGQPAMQYQPEYAAQAICERERIAGTAWEQCKATLVQPFNIRSERLFRIRLIEAGDDLYLFMDFHHIIFDGTSMQILGADMEKAFCGEKIETETWTAYDAAMAERAARQSDAWKNAREWYLNSFGEADGSALPEGDLKGRERAFGDLRLTLDLSAHELEAACGILKTSENVLTTAAFGVVLSSYTAKKSALFSTIYNGRRDPRTKRTVSMFVTTLPVLCRIGKDLTVAEYLAELKEQLLGAMANDVYSFAELASERDVDSDVQFAWQTDILTLPKDSKLPLTREELPFTITGSALTAELYPADGRLILHIQYRADRFSEDYITRFARCFGHVLKEMTAKPKLSDVKLVDETEEKALLELSRGKTLLYDKAETWLDLFLGHVLKAPDRTAVVDCRGSWTYAELDSASNRIAAYLLQKGVTEGSFVALMTGRVKEFVAAVIGIQRAGAAYVPVDPEYPEDRIAYILEDSDAKVVLTEETIAQALEAVQHAESLNRATPAHRAYMIYTSGSTGKPKGVVQSHRSLRAFTEWRMKMLSITDNSIHAVHPSFSFDASLDDLFPPLAAGGEIHILSEELRRDMQGMRDYIQAHHINALTLPTQMGMAMVNQYPDMPLDFVMMGGEKMLPCARTNIRLFNGYGPTEFTVCSSWHEVDQEKDTGNIPIGRPVANTWSFICDASGRLLPRGVAGELCLAGPQIAERYWKQQQLTEEKFVSCPFAKVTDGKMYRTGDLARYNGAGELEFLGRIDTQVKLHGFRIELGEVETVAGRYAGITEAVAEVRNDQLVLYYTSDTQTDRDALRRFLSDSLANYMVPTLYIQLDEMPMTPNGKIDRKKLPGPDVADDEAFTAPETETEKALCAMACKILGTDAIGVNANLVARGLSSIGAMQLSAEISRNLHVRVSVVDILKAPVVREIAALIGLEESGTREELTAYARQALYPITENQRGVFIDWQMNPKTTQYNIPSVAFYGSVDGQALKEAVCMVVDAHSYIKAGLVYADEDVMLRRRDEEPAVVGVYELEREPDKAFFQSLVAPFDLLNDRLYRINVYIFGGKAWLFTDIHHIVFDGLSGVIFNRDIRAVLNGEKPEPESVTAFDYALYEKKLQGGQAYAAAESYFDVLLSGAVAASLPSGKHLDGPASCMDTFTMEADEINDFCYGIGVTPGSYFSAAFAETLKRITREDKVMFTTVSNGRSAGAALQNCVGMFVRTLPAVSLDSRALTVKEYAVAFHRELLDSYAREFYPYTRMVERSHVTAEIMFAYQGGLADTAGGEGEPKEGTDDMQPALDTAKLPISVDVFPQGDHYTLLFEYDGRIYDREDIACFAGAFINMARNLTKVEYVREAALISDAETDAILALSAGERFSFDAEQTWLDLFVAQVAKTPEKTAVVDAESSYTYEALDRASDRIAAYLIANGVEQNHFVGVKMGRVKAFHAAVLGIHKAGAAYVPIDPEYPEDRIQYMISDSGTKVVLTDENVAEILSDGRLDGPVMPKCTPDHAAYMIYTSGTTGRPKGVVIQHKALLSFVHFIRTQWELSEDSRIALFANFVFDGSIEDVFPALTTGGAVFIVPESARHNPQEMKEYIKSNRISGGFIPTQFAQLIGADEALDLDYMSIGGEAATSIPHVRGKLYNTYGPTEFTVDATYCELDQNKPYRTIPIGRPLFNCSAYIMDTYGHLLPRGLVGEICLSGPQLALCYWNRPELTEEKFTVCNLGRGRNARVYHTGDLARYNEEGELEFLGRIDTQVKLRGFRIELGEIENTASRYEGITQVAAVVFREQLVLYFTADRSIDQKDLRAFLSGSLTEYMVPAVYMQLDEMPVTHNGKIDRKKLPEPVRQDSYEEPATALERELCEQYAKTLGLKKVGALDSFFEIGGSSISASSLLTFAMGKGYPIVYQDIFRNPTPRQLAAVITGAASSEHSGQAADYDYSRIDSLIAQNTMEHLDELSAEPMGNVILIGATGFLGIHVLHQYLETSKGKIFCLMRKVQWDTAEKHLQSLLMYYFGDTYEELFGDRIFCLEGDITDKSSLLAIDAVKADMIINCAASVKHFVKDDSLDRINFHGVENLIEVCLKNHMRLVQVSTLSVGGGTEAGGKDRLYEKDLYFGQILDNDYIRTKFLAERAILEARVERGLDAVILRAGNLMGRYSDGEFQINLLTNAFMRSLAAFNRLGACPVTALAEAVELSPIDSTAAAMLTLAGVNSKFSIFNVNNNHSVTMGDIIFALNRHGLQIAIVTEKEFAGIMQAASKNDSYSESIMSMTAYEARGGENLTPVESDNYFTVNALYRLGFKWPIVDDAYLERIISAVDTLEFFQNL